MKENRDSLIFRVLPRRAFLPVAGVFLMQFVAYYIPKLINRGRVFNDLTTALDEAIPFVPVFVLFYILAFLQWCVYYLIIAREDKDIMCRFLTAGAMSKFLCMVLFIVLPTAIVRPDASGGSVFRFCCRVVYYFDEPSNLFPSMHCLESWFCMRLALEEFRRGRVPEVSRSIIHGYKGEMIQCVNRREFKTLEEYLIKIRRVELESFFERLVSRRKWRLDKQIEAAVDDAVEVAENSGEVYVKVHVFRTSLLSALVLLSTVFIKQHYVLDMAAAVVIAELTLHIGKLISKKTAKKGAVK